MKAKLIYNDHNYTADFSKPLDLSIALGQVKCFYAPEVTMSPCENGDFIGSVKKGAPVNFYNVALNPHGNGTHTECLGHITKKQESVNKQLKIYHHIAQVITVDLTPKGKNDLVITKKSIKAHIGDGFPPALIIRTRPNTVAKQTKDYSGTNPPYLNKDAMQYLVDRGIEHLLIDLPSVDRELDKGKLAAHHIFWKLGPAYKSNEARKYATITELIFVKNSIKDGLYLLNIQLTPLQLDAAPSRPVLYKLNKSR